MIERVVLKKGIKICPVCNKVYPQDYNYCPECENDNRLPVLILED